MITKPFLWRLRLFYANPPSARGGTTEMYDLMFGDLNDPNDFSDAETAAKELLRERDDLVRVEVLHPHKDVVHATFFASQP